MVHTAWECLSSNNYSMQECDTDPLFVKNVNCDLGDFKFPELSIT